MFDIQEELRKLPSKPGVYLMKDMYDNILYIGKAVVLKNRVRQYFQPSANLTPRIRTMVSKIARFEYIVTTSELEALVLECNLIKAHKPRYNVLLKDDKSYPYIKVTIEEEFPRVYMTRKVLKDSSKYFGPYTDINAVKETIRLLKKIFPLKLCEKELPRDIGKDRPCLNFHINQCLAPCQGGINAKEYRQMIKDLCDFLSGKQREVINKLESDMNTASENMDFERAAIIRDRIIAAQKLNEKQKVSQAGENDSNIDIVGMSRGTSDACVQVFFVRNGKLINRESFMFKGISDVEDGEIITSFIKQFYGIVNDIPKEILLHEEINESRVIEEWLSHKKKSKVELKIPYKGDKKNLLEMAKRNAEIELQRHGLGYQAALKQLQEILGINFPINRIEAFDISNLGESAIVGSMVVFEGKMDRRQYKRYRIKSISKQNDIKSLCEVISRRLRRAELLDSDSASFRKLPQVFLIDGGKNQVNAVLDVVRKSEIEISVAGMVKDKKHRTRALILENNNEIDLKKYSQVFKLVSEIQEEAHRFAVDYHRKLRRKESIKSILDEIQGVGNIRKRELFKHFSSIDSIRNATVDQLSNVKGMNLSIAKVVYDFFRMQEKKQ